jgi:hypothetical protein
MFIPDYDKRGQMTLNEWLFISSIGMKIYKKESNIKTKQHIYIKYMKLYMNEISRCIANS